MKCCKGATGESSSRGRGVGPPGAPVSQEVIMRTPGPSGARGSLRKGAVVAVIAYLLVTALAAFATAMAGDASAAFFIWIGGSLILFVAVLTLASRSLSISNRVKRVAVSLLLALGVSGVAAFIGIVVIVNILERLGLEH